MRAADFLFKELAETYGIKHIFLISGGGNMHLVDALGKNKNLNYVSNHHEQASAIAAEAYARVKNDIGVCLVTTGPGGTNAITGVFGAWTDSIPVLFISGQVKQETLATPPLRQLGDQEINIVDIVKPITKYAVMIRKPEEIQYHLDKAIYIAKSGKPGPVWLDIPLDIQSANISNIRLKKFTTKEKKLLTLKSNKQILKKQIGIVTEKIKKSKRPVLFVGQGVRLGHGEKILQKIVQKLKIPVLTSFLGIDLIDDKNPYFFGRPGTIGGRAANFILQNADLVLVIGSRLNLRVISYNYKAFARKAYKIAVDIDSNELFKKTFANFNLKITADTNVFLSEFIQQISINEKKSNISSWIKYCQRIKKTYPVVTDEHKNIKNYVSAYYFINKLSQLLNNKSTIAMGDGMACVVPYKVFEVKYGQRLIQNSGSAAMGYDLPAAVGSCFAKNKKEVICIAGDGSIMLNIQELQTVIHHKLPIKIFILVNDGYLSIRSTQDTYFNKLHIASGSDSGVTCPDFIKIGKAFGLKCFQITDNKDVVRKINKVLAELGPVICTVKLDPKEQMLPKLSSEILRDGTMISKPLEDLFPFLPRDEFKANMLIPLADEE